MTAPRFVRIARRSWLSEHDADDLAARCAAIVATSAPDTVVVGTTAARLHDMWLPDVEDEIQVATRTPDRVASRMTRSKRPELATRRVGIRDDELTTVSGIPVTTAARTWRDLATQLGLPALVAAGDSVLRRGTTRDELAELIGRGNKVRGIVRARAALPLVDERSRSRPESHLRVAVSGIGVQFAINEAVFRDGGGWLAEPDLSVPEAKLALEYQGIDHAEPERMRKDMTRFADLRSEGWLVLPYGPAEVFGRPWQIEGEVRAAIRDRARALLRRPSR